jgi:hypothetical protein
MSREFQCLKRRRIRAAEKRVVKLAVMSLHHRGFRRENCERLLREAAREVEYANAWTEKQMREASAKMYRAAAPFMKGARS